jgi:hypothetical protein
MCQEMDVAVYQLGSEAAKREDNKSRVSYSY